VATPRRRGAQALGPIPTDLVAAKEMLRDRLFSGLVPEDRKAALGLRRAGRFRPAPEVNLVGVGIGERVAAAAPTGELAVKVYVARKFPKGRIERRDLIPAHIDGIPTDIEGVGYVRKHQSPHRERHRPAPGGVSVSPDAQTIGVRSAGTLGLVLVNRLQPGRRYILSNNHVLADENRVAVGAPMLQPGALDDGVDADRIATLSQFVPLLFDNRRNWMDAALARFDRASDAAPLILGIGAPLGSVVPALNAVVRKAGRTTGLTEGIVRAVRFDAVNIQYDRGLVAVHDVIVIRTSAPPFSRPGDSGSAIVDASGRVAALLFAGSDVVTFAIPIRRILRRFGVRVAR
jgi:S1-C subfamily serine protease